MYVGTYIYTLRTPLAYTVGKLKDLTTRFFMEQIYPNYKEPPSCKTATFFLGPWLLVCQFIEISNQIEVTGQVSNFG